jgi:hypothetical protein
MNSSLISADCTTHLKILAVSLVASIFVVCVGINARLKTSDSLSESPRLERNMSKPAILQSILAEADSLDG